MAPCVPNDQPADPLPIARGSLLHKNLVWPTALCNGDGDGEIPSEPEEFEKPTVVPFDPLEPAVKYKYDPSRNAWTKEHTFVRLSPSQLAQGCMRHAYPMMEFSPEAPPSLRVAKLSKILHDPRSVYFSEVRLQAKCAELAEEFNKFRPPKKVEFIDAWVIEMKRRKHPSGVGKLVMIVEPLLYGKFLKYNNNLGFVAADVPLDTPHAFSHFSFHLTLGELLVCDIQGVGHTFTDPQIHSNTDNGWLYGKGDYGRQGIENFFKTHQCNDVCRMFRLPKCPLSSTLPPVAWDMACMVPEKVVKRIVSSFWCSPPEDPPEDTTKANPVAAAAVALAAVAGVLLAERPPPRPLPASPPKVTLPTTADHPRAPPSPELHRNEAATPAVERSRSPTPAKSPTAVPWKRQPGVGAALELDVQAIADSLAYPIVPSPKSPSPMRRRLTPTSPAPHPHGAAQRAPPPYSPAGRAAPVATSPNSKPVDSVNPKSPPPASPPHRSSAATQRVPPYAGGPALPTLADFLRVREAVLHDNAAARPSSAWPGPRLS